MQIQLACVQMQSALGNKEENLKRMTEAVHRVKQLYPEVSLIVFPECAVTGYECPEQYAIVAEPWPGGESLRTLSALAREVDVALVYGFVESDSQGEQTRFYNSAALIERDGTPLGRYRKTHLVEGMETDFFEAGDEFPVFDTSFGKVGIMICWDCVFPEVARMLAVNGAELILVPEAVEKGIEREWDLALAARAFDNVAYVASCNHVGTDRSLSYFGRSAIYAPLGEIISQAGEDEQILTATIDYALLRERREYFYMLRRRRPSIYQPLAKA